jgi:hypothetical protein
VQFEIVYEPEPHEQKLYDAFDRLKAEQRLPRHAFDMMREVQKAAANVSSLFDTDAWAIAGKQMGFVEEARKALKDHVHLKSPREARQLAEFIWSPRKNRRGRNQEINSDLLRSILECIERIAGRELSYKRRRSRRAGPGRPTTGRPEGPMLDVLLAALDWAQTVPNPQATIAPVQAEGVLSAIKRIRRRSGQI